MLAAVVVVKLVLSRRTRIPAGNDLRAMAAANSRQHLRDAATSAAAFAGISTTLLGGPGWETADDWASLGAATVMGCNGIAILLSALRGAIDSRRSGRIMAAMRQAATNVAGVLAVERLVVRRSAGIYEVIIHVQTLPSMPLCDAHALGGQVKAAMQDAISGAGHVHVHMEPHDL